MIEYELDTAHSTLLVHPKSALDKNDFGELARAVDTQIEVTGDLAGLIIDAPEFPGWDSFGTMVTHLRFVRDHHKRVKKVAIVTNSQIGDVAEHLASHFVSAEVRHFPGEQLEQARQWISGGSDAGPATESGPGAPPQASQI
jgi:SpoIIAA-like